MSCAISFLRARFCSISTMRLAALLVGGEERVEVEVDALVLDGGADDVGVLADEGDVEHEGATLNENGATMRGPSPRANRAASARAQ